MENGFEKIEPKTEAVEVTLKSGLTVMINDLDSMIFIIVFHNKENKTLEISYKKGTKKYIKPF